MRPIVFLIIMLFVAVPALMMLFSQGRTVAQRALLAFVIFAVPFAMIMMVNMVPALNGTSLQHASAWRAIGVLLMTSSFILPWCLFAMLRGR